VICNGYAQALVLLVQVLAKTGAKRIAIEDPSSCDDARPVAASVGIDVVGIPVGDEGMRVDLLAASEADAVIVTPSHQWPTGAVLSAESRAAMLRWAEGRGAVVIEDDYDAEYRYDRAPIGTIQGLAPDQVVYAGTASKTLAPGLRVHRCRAGPPHSRPRRGPAFRMRRGQDQERGSLPDDVGVVESDNWLAGVPAPLRDHLSQALGNRTPEVAERVAAILSSSRPGDEGYLRRLRTTGYRVSDEDSATVFTGPTLIVTGRHDRIAGYADQFRTVASYPQASFAAIAGAGHYLPFERPEVFGHLVREWLDRFPSVL
jgi:pimeloyl-ACP methyl ester carboxylesterase